MAEKKNFLDHAGLQRYDAKIKAFIASQDKDVTDKLMALIGAAEEGNEKTILARVKDLETAVGDVKNLPKEVQNLVAAILGESTRAKAAEEALGNRLNIIEGEAEGSIKKALADARTYADGKDAAIAAAKKAGDDAQADVDALEAKVGTVAEGKTVVGMIGEANTNITNLTTRMGTAEGKITTLESEMDAVEAKASEFCTAICVRLCIVRVSVGLLGLYRTFFIIGGRGCLCLRLREGLAMVFRRITADREWVVCFCG